MARTANETFDPIERKESAVPTADIVGSIVSPLSVSAGAINASPSDLPEDLARSTQAHLVIGTIIKAAVSDETAYDELVVSTPQGPVACVRASGCLVSPQEGDLVLSAIADEGRDGDPERRGFVIQLLSRNSQADDLTVIDPGTARLKVMTRDIEIAALNRLRFSAPIVAATADKITLVAATSLGLIGGLLTRSFKTIRSIAGFEESISETQSTTTDTRVASVKGTDTLRAGSQVETVEGVASHRAGTKVITAEHDVRVDGERISMG